MKEIAGYWFPDREEGLARKLTHSPYQQEKYQAALSYVPRPRVALDVGAHVGLWTRQMQADFEYVVAFEPDAEKHDCFRRNVDLARCRLCTFGLSDQSRSVSLVHKTGTSLKTHVSRKAPGAIELRRLDDVAELPSGIDLLKIDVEGYEYFALKGAERTVNQFRPVIIVEQKPGVASERYGIGDRDALRLLESWGYEVRQELRGDFILTPS